MHSTVDKADDDMTLLSRRPIVDQLNPVSQAYQHYDQKAVFSDPIGIAQNLEEVKAQFK